MITADEKQTEREPSRRFSGVADRMGDILSNFLIFHEMFFIWNARGKDIPFELVRAERKKEKKKKKKKKKIEMQ